MELKAIAITAFSIHTQLIHPVGGFEGDNQVLISFHP